jgi:dihydropteroate synthase
MPLTTREWKIGRRSLSYGDRTLVMGVLNVTPDSFSDGGQFSSLNDALAHAEQMINEGADIIDIGGESTRPGSNFVSEDEELCRVIPVIERLANLPVPISIDTTKAAVARVALQAGAEIVNDISGLRFEPAIAGVAAEAGAGLVLMHSRGTPKDMQEMSPMENAVNEVMAGLSDSVALAEGRGLARGNIAIDPGIGFGKTLAQNLELIASLDQIAHQFADMPVLIGTSRKSFLGKLLSGAPASDRLHGTIATIVAAVLHGAHIVRVHDVKSAIEALKITDAIRNVN